jgi:hypothetical protein
VCVLPAGDREIGNSGSASAAASARANKEQIMKNSAVKLATLAGVVLTATALSASPAAAIPLQPRGGFPYCRVFEGQLSLADHWTLQGRCFGSMVSVAIRFSTPPGSGGGTPYTENAITNSRGFFSAPMHWMTVLSPTTETIHASAETALATLSVPDQLFIQ